MGTILPGHKQTYKTTLHDDPIGTDGLLLIFTRNPVPGKCKTRLATTVGDEAALEIYMFLLRHTVAITKGLSAVKHVYYSEEIGREDVWSTDFYDKRLQKGSDLGIRMANAFRDGFTAGFKKIVIIGSDMFDLTESDIETAFDRLDDNEFVIGPASDGGYYLLGMKAFEPSLFQNKSWGGERVLSDTLKDLQNRKLALLDERNDVDRYEDIKDNKAFYPYLKHVKK